MKEFSDVSGNVVNGAYFHFHYLTALFSQWICTLKNWTPSRLIYRGHWGSLATISRPTSRLKNYRHWWLSSSHFAETSICFSRYPHEELRVETLVNHMFWWFHKVSMLHVINVSTFWVYALSNLDYCLSFVFYVCVRDGEFRSTVNLLCKYLGDFLIASYLDYIQESGYDCAYVKEIEVFPLLCDSQFSVSNEGKITFIFLVPKS